MEDWRDGRLERWKIGKRRGFSRLRIMGRSNMATKSINMFIITLNRLSFAPGSALALFRQLALYLPIMNRLPGILGCLAGLSAVILGALGAHALEATLAQADTAAAWQTAVDYQMWHALALLLCATLGSSSRKMRAAVAFFITGIVLFSGSLYWLALEGPRWLGPITPLGGLCLIAGWICLGAVFLVHKRTPPD